MGDQENVKEIEKKRKTQCVKIKKQPRLLRVNFEAKFSWPASIWNDLKTKFMKFKKETAGSLRN